MHSFGIIGAGAWGTALATVIRRAGHDVTIRAHEQSVVQSINSKHLNDGFYQAYY
jgi:glycerol-3-phosphate dehydrogenase (NAD(P)+)